MPPQSKPLARITDDEHHHQVAVLAGRRRVLDDERIRVVASIRPAVEEQAHEQAADLLEQAREHVEALTAIAEQVREAVVEVAEAANVLDAADPLRGRVDLEAPTPADVARVVEAVETGVDLLAVQVPRRLGWAGVPVRELRPPVRTA